MVAATLLGPRIARLPALVDSSPTWVTAGPVAIPHPTAAGGLHTSSLPLEERGCLLSSSRLPVQVARAPIHPGITTLGKAVIPHLRPTTTMGRNLTMGPECLRQVGLLDTQGAILIPVGRRHPEETPTVQVKHVDDVIRVYESSLLYLNVMLIEQATPRQTRLRHRRWRTARGRTAFPSTMTRRSSRPCRKIQTGRTAAGRRRKLPMLPPLLPPLLEVLARTT